MSIYTQPHQRLSSIHMQTKQLILGVAIAASHGAASAAAPECKTILQAWALNYALEEVCTFDGGVADYLKAIGKEGYCQTRLTKQQTDAAIREVLLDIKSDYEKWGKDDLCNSQYIGYKQLQDSIENPD